MFHHQGKTKKRPVLPLIACLLLFSFIVGNVYGEDRITSYASLDLKVFDSNYISEVEGKSILSFRYLINETFQISILVKTYNPQMPRVLLQYCPDTGTTGYRRGDFFKVPLFELELNRDFPGLLELDMSQIPESISDFAYVSRITKTAKSRTMMNTNILLFILSLLFFYKIDAITRCDFKLQILMCFN